MSLRPFGADRVEAGQLAVAWVEALTSSLRPFGADRVEAQLLDASAQFRDRPFGPSGPTALKRQ